MKRTFFISAIVVLFFSMSYAQNGSQETIHGFHVGVLGEGSVSQKISVTPTHGQWPIPAAHATMGWKTGVEFSYHFVRYFGVSLGFAVGSIAPYKFDVCFPNEDFFDAENSFFPFLKKNELVRFQLPLKVEFHTPLYGNWSLYGAVGVKLLNIVEAFDAACRAPEAGNFCGLEDYFYGDILVEDKPERVFFASISEQDRQKMTADMTLNLGVYYRLPYADLIRLSIVGSFSFKDRMAGYYEFPTREAGGVITCRDNYIGLEFAYLHGFKTKAERVLQRQKKGKDQ